VKLRFSYVSRNLTMRINGTRFPTRVSVSLLAALLYGCASSAPKEQAPPSPSANPLQGMVGRQVVVLPVQLVATSGPAGTWDVRPDLFQLLPLLDQEIADTFRRRGVRNNWTFGEEIVASANRNAGLAGNPRGLPVAGIRRIKASDTPLPEPLASEIRTIVSLTNARYVVMPIEARIELGSAQRKASLNLLLIDSRTARVLWTGEITGTPSSDPAVVRDTLSPYGFRIVARELAGLFADLVLAE
jgi:hypothetical protein